MFPRSKSKVQDMEKEQERNEADEERMASRLHLEMGMQSGLRDTEILNADIYCIEHDTLAKKLSSKNVKAVEVFRGVSFDDWLRVFMQVLLFCFSVIS